MHTGGGKQKIHKITEKKKRNERKIKYLALFSKE